MRNTRLFLLSLLVFMLASSCQNDLDELSALSESAAMVPNSGENSSTENKPAATEKKEETPPPPQKEEPKDSGEEKKDDPAPSQTPAAAAAPAPAGQPGPANQQETRKNAPPMLNVPTFGYYNIPSDINPLFSPSCLLAKDPERRSMEMLREWLTEKLKNRENGLLPGEFSVQYISFEIAENGKIGNIVHQGSKGNVFCRPCIEIALETIREMPRWMPGMAHGKPVRVTIKLPVRFEVL